MGWSLPASKTARQREIAASWAFVDFCDLHLPASLLEAVFELISLRHTVNPIKLETGLRPNGAGIPFALLLGIEAIGFPTFVLLL